MYEKGLVVVMNNISVRIAKISDAKELLEIYSYYVENTAVSFEYKAPTVEEFKIRISTTLAKYPYIVAVEDDKPVGYAYASPFHNREAYGRSVETSIYVSKDKRKSGIGRILYQSLEKMLAMQNILNLNACIAYPETEDEYLTKNSVLFHEKLGYTKAGEFHKCGFKFDRWYNVIWMEKHIGEHTKAPLPVKTFDEIRKNIEWLE